MDKMDGNLLLFYYPTALEIYFFMDKLSIDLLKENHTVWVHGACDLVLLGGAPIDCLAFVQYAIQNVWCTGRLQYPLTLSEFSEELVKSHLTVSKGRAQEWSMVCVNYQANLVADMGKWIFQVQQCRIFPPCCGCLQFSKSTFSDNIWEWEIWIMNAWWCVWCRFKMDDVFWWSKSSHRPWYTVLSFKTALFFCE